MQMFGRNRAKVAVTAIFLACTMIFSCFPKLVAESPDEAEGGEEALGLKYSDPISLGDAVKVFLSQAVEVYENGEGGYNTYFVNNGKPSTFYVLDTLTGEKIFSQEISNVSVCWRMTRGSDGNIYFGSTEDGSLFRYSVNEKKLEQVGQYTGANFTWDIEASDDGRIFGMMYPGSKMYEYNIASGEIKDLGSLDSTQEYVRGSGIHGKYLYAGTGAELHFYKINIETYEKSEIKLPTTGSKNMVQNVEVIGDRLLVKAGKWQVLDLETEEWLGDFLTNDHDIAYPSKNEPNKVYYANTGDLYYYDLSDNTSTKLEGITVPNDIIRELKWVEKDGREVLFGSTKGLEMFYYDPSDNSVHEIKPQSAIQGLKIKSIEKAPFEDTLYIGGYQGGFSALDLTSDEFIVNYPGVRQPEAFGFMNDKVYIGGYPGTFIYEFDSKEAAQKPNKDEYNPENNPYTIHRIRDGQDRPFSFETFGNKLFIGSVPDYGLNGGALTIYDQDANSWKTYKNLVFEQSIIGLAAKDGKLYGSTSIYGGLGISPTATSAKIFVWDINTNQKLEEFTPTFPNQPDGAKAIGELSVGPDGLIWGSANGTVFAMNPDTLNIEKSVVIAPPNNDDPLLVPDYLRWGENGLLYTTTGRRITAIDPESMVFQNIVPSTWFMDLGLDDSIYYGIGPTLYKIECLSGPIIPEPTETTETTESTTPTDPSKPTETAEPTKPSGTTEPTESTKPTGPIEPTKPTDSTEKNVDDLVWVDNSMLTWTQKDEELVLKANGSLEDLMEVRFDDQLIYSKAKENPLETDNYKLEEGSTVLTLKRAFLSHQSEGKHEVVMLFADGKTIEGGKLSQTIEIKLGVVESKPTITTSNQATTQTNSTDKSDVTATGDSFIAIGIGGLCLGLVAVLLITRKRFNHDHD